MDLIESTITGLNKYITIAPNRKSKKREKRKLIILAIFHNLSFYMMELLDMI